ncbi:hypothetical protein LIPSTDRAFT_7069 [Lipomyces starkeyi NRRL Y-11557]|uniref:Uncharacterized protein n=1 Tax=Lipomyces starkeyi NRRL Y-11557 TaxID=675824 RepID=A0A1E3PVG6_LIPST|nr:hypothetical protein LIPSTDRAFT_7069 [Lipomyces starkeyi NRRL Y-11557]
MADSDCEILSDSGVDDLSVGSFKRLQRARRLDYRLLNDGSDDEAAPEDRMVKRGRFPSPLDSSQPITPDDSASQLSKDVDQLEIILRMRRDLLMIGNIIRFYRVLKAFCPESEHSALVVLQRLSHLWKVVVPKVW